MFIWNLDSCFHCRQQLCDFVDGFSSPRLGRFSVTKSVLVVIFDGFFAWTLVSVAWFNCCGVSCSSRQWHSWGHHVGMGHPLRELFALATMSSVALGRLSCLIQTLPLMFHILVLNSWECHRSGCLGNHWSRCLPLYILILELSFCKMLCFSMSIRIHKSGEDYESEQYGRFVIFLCFR